MSHNPDDVTAKDVSVSKTRTRVAMVVFADVEGDDTCQRVTLRGNET